MTSAQEHRARWRQSILDLLQSCIGQQVVGVTVDEMGMYGPDEAPFFTHPDLPFVQANVLEIAFEDGRHVRVCTWQDDDEFALHAKDAPPDGLLRPEVNPDRTLFRVRPMPEFPSGKVDAVTWEECERGNIQRLTLHIDDATVILRAGEVCEDFDGMLTVHTHDESVLVFLSEAAHAGMIFGRPAYRI